MNRHLRILVVEDDEISARLLADTLHQADAVSVEVLNDGSAAWSRLHVDPSIDILVSDVNLPGLDGHELIRRMKADVQLRLIPAILVTADDQQFDPTYALGIGADDILAKPIRPKQMLARLCAARRLCMLHRELADKNAALSDSLARLERSQNNLLQARKMEAIGQLASGIAHEINTPVQFISDNLGFLKEQIGGLTTHLDRCRQLEDTVAAGRDATPLLAQLADSREEVDLDFVLEEMPLAVDQALEGTVRVGEIVQAMRDFAHPGSDQDEPVDLNAIIASTLLVSRNSYKYVAEVRQHLQEQLPSLPGDAGALKQVVLNLIVNAAQAIEDRHRSGDTTQGTITICTSAADAWVVLEVEDDGCGMDSVTIERVFEPFFTTKEPGRGTGQGLAIIHNIVTVRHHGHIDVNSLPGQGTTMRIRLPLERATTATPV